MSVVDILTRSAQLCLKGFRVASPALIGTKELATEGKSTLAFCTGGREELNCCGQVAGSQHDVGSSPDLGQPIPNQLVNEFGG